MGFLISNLSVLRLLIITNFIIIFSQMKLSRQALAPAAMVPKEPRFYELTGQRSL